MPTKVATDLEQFVAAEGRDEQVARVREEIDREGISYVYYQFPWVTGRIMGKGVPSPHWETLAAKATEQEEWTHELELNSLTPAYMGSEATRKLFAQQAGDLRSILSELGLAK